MDEKTNTLESGEDLHQRESNENEEGNRNVFARKTEGAPIIHFCNEDDLRKLSLLGIGNSISFVNVMRIVTVFV